MKIIKGSLEAMEAEVVLCLEKLMQKKITSVTTEYIYKDRRELRSRYSALEQLLGELNYWLGISGSISEELAFDQLITRVDPSDFWRTVQAYLNPAKTVFDLGCGVRPSMLFAPELRICVETFEPYHQYLRDRFSRVPLVIIKEDVLEFLKRQPDKSIDTLVANDLIEHLERPKGEKFLLEIERTVVNQALIFTPYGFMEQHVDEGSDGWGWSGNKHQTHLSGWLPEDFPGWKIIFSKDYHLSNKSYSEGAFAAIYKPNETNKKKNINLILKDEKLTPGKLIENLYKDLKHPSDFAFQVILPPSHSVGSHLIRAEDPKISVPVVITSFNLVIRRPKSIIDAEEGGASGAIGLFGLAEKLRIDSAENSSLNLIITSDNEFKEKLIQTLSVAEVPEDNFQFIDSNDLTSMTNSIICSLNDLSDEFRKNS
jgi:hypothetical protein